MSKVIVTGASGFIGAALSSRLHAQGWDVVQINSSVGDIANRGTLSAFDKEEISHVFHLAGKTFVPDSWDDPQTFCQTNVTGTFNILELCRRRHVPMTYVSAYVYGHPDSLPIGEDSSICPSNPYALTKRLAEEACEFYARTYDLPVTTIRPFNVYGIGQAANFLIPAIVSQALATGVDEIEVKDLSPKRDYVYLEDMVTALMATLKKFDGYRIYNIGSGVSLSVQEVIDVIQDIAGTQKQIVCERMIRTNELMDVVADISKAGIELGWHPEHTFSAGIAKIIGTERSKREHGQA